ncbi:MAG TPA: hypothetical protein QF901_01640, partial [Gammaproteobacteria bacterium]|nr:hypothetical protein [Gammaproteobacteria bacterium]
MAPSLHRGLSERQLRWWLSCFFLALAIPAVLLIYRAYDQLKWEVFHQYRVSAEELTARIDAELSHSIEIEEARSFSDYAFLTVAGEASAGFVQRSPLSAFPVKAGIPGLVGYFQVDSRGTLTSPVVPDPGTDHEAYGVSDDEYRRRLALSEQLQYVLGDPLDEGGRRRDKDAAMAPVVVKEKAVEWRAAADAKADSINETQNVFDRLSSTLGKAARRQTPGDYGRVEDLQLDSRLEKKSREQKLMQPAAPPRPFTSGKRESRKERVAVYELAEQGDPDLAAVEEMEADDGFSSPAPTTALLQPEVSAGSVVTPAPRVRLFESEIDPFGFELLDAVHFVMFRNVWRGGERFI